MSLDEGVDGEVSLEVRMSISSGEHLSLRTTNRATPANAAMVKRLLKRLKKTTPQLLYQELLRETVKRAQGSGLGLVRIAAECDMSLAMTFADGVLAIEAATLPAPPHRSQSRPPSPR